MIVDIEQSPSLAQFQLPKWAAAEVLDTRLTDNLTLRALVCRLAAARWQWSVMSLEGDHGALITAGVSASLNAAREAVATEIAKCVEDGVVQN